MPPELLAPMTRGDVDQRQAVVLSHCNDKDDRLRALFFPTDADLPHLVDIPNHHGNLSFNIWLFEPERINYLLSRPGVHLIGIKRRVFKKFPCTRGGVPLKSAYSVYYWTQEADMLVNRALANVTSNAAPHLHVRGDVMVLKHLQSSEEKYEDMKPEDEALVCTVLDNAVSHGKLDYVVDHEFNVIHIEE